MNRDNAPEPSEWLSPPDADTSGDWLHAGPCPPRQVEVNPCLLLAAADMVALTLPALNLAASVEAKRIHDALRKAAQS